MNSPGDTKRLVAAIRLRHAKVQRTMIARVWNLSDNGMAPFEIAAHCGLPIQLVTLILRGGAPGATK